MKEKTLIIPYNAKDIESDMNLIEKYSLEILMILEEIQKGNPYYKESIEDRIMMISGIKNYANKMKMLVPHNEASNCLKDVCNDK